MSKLALYRKERNYIKISIWGVAFLMVFVLMVWKIEPNGFFIETGAMIFLSGGIFLVFWGINRTVKWAAIVSLTLLAILLMQRWQLTNPVTIGGLITIIGIASLVN